MHMIRIVTKTPPTFTANAPEERHNLSNEALRERFEVKRWSQKIQDARRREFQRTVNRSESHPTYQVMFSEPGQERKIQGRRYPVRPVGNSRCWIDNTCQIKQVSLADGYDQAKRKLFYIKHKKKRTRRVREEYIDQIIAAMDNS